MQQNREALTCSDEEVNAAHISSLLRDLHWLRVPDGIVFRLAALVFRCRNCTAPARQLLVKWTKPRARCDSHQRVSKQVSKQANVCLRSIPYSLSLNQ